MHNVHTVIFLGDWLDFPSFFLLVCVMCNIVVFAFSSVSAVDIAGSAAAAAAHSVYNISFLCNILVV